MHPFQVFLQTKDLAVLPLGSVHLLLFWLRTMSDNQDKRNRDKEGKDTANEVDHSMDEIDSFRFQLDCDDELFFDEYLMSFYSLDDEVTTLESNAMAAGLFEAGGGAQQPQEVWIDLCFDDIRQRKDLPWAQRLSDEALKERIREGIIKAAARKQEAIVPAASAASLTAETPVHNERAPIKRRPKFKDGYKKKPKKQRKEDSDGASNDEVALDSVLACLVVL